MDEVYIVIDTDAMSYKDMIMAIYKWEHDAESCRMMYESSVAKNDPSRFKVIVETILE